MMRVLLILLVFQSAWAQTPELNVKVVDFALKNLDRKVGKGVCWELVYEALAANKATFTDTSTAVDFTRDGSGGNPAVCLMVMREADGSLSVKTTVLSPNALYKKSAREARRELF